MTAAFMPAINIVLGAIQNIHIVLSDLLQSAARIVYAPNSGDGATGMS